MKKLFLILLFLAACVVPARAQQNWSLTAAAASCTTSNTSCLVVTVDATQGGAGFTVTTNPGNTLQFEGTGDGGKSWVALAASPSSGGAAVTSTTSTGTWIVGTVGYTAIRIRMSTLASGTSTVSITQGLPSARGGGPGGGGSGSITSCTTAGGVAYENGTSDTLTCGAPFTFDGTNGTATVTAQVDGHSALVLNPSSQNFGSVFPVLNINAGAGTVTCEALGGFAPAQMCLNGATNQPWLYNLAILGDGTNTASPTIALFDTSRTSPNQAVGLLTTGNVSSDFSSDNSGAALTYEATDGFGSQFVISGDHSVQLGMGAAGTPGAQPYFTWGVQGDIPAGYINGSTGEIQAGWIPNAFAIGGQTGFLSVVDAAKAHKVSITNPGTLSANYNFALPIAAGSSGQVLLSAGGGTSPMTWSSAPTFSALNCGVLNTTACMLTGYGSTSGTATLTWPAVAGTATNPVTFSNIIAGPEGAVATPVYGFTSDTGTGMWQLLSGLLDFSVSATDILQLATTTVGVEINGAAPLGWSAASPTAGNPDTAFSRDSGGVVDLGTGAQGNKGGSLNLTNTTASGTLRANTGFNANGTAGITDAGLCSATFGSTLGLVTTCTAASDPRLKVFGAYSHGLDAIMQIEPIHFHWNKVGLQAVNLSSKYNAEQIGFSAKNIQQAIPEAVGHERHGGVEYLSLPEGDRPIVAALVNAVHEQQAEIDALKMEVAKLKTTKH